MTPRDVIARLIDVSIGFPSNDGTVDTVVDRVSLTIQAGERVGLIGASGSGKSLTALSLLGLVPPPGAIVGGSIKIQGTDILSDSDSKKRRLRGATIGMVFQEAESALNPVLTIGTHLKEMVRRHRPNEGPQWREIAIELLKKVDLEPTRILKSHPHRLSGGQRQRALLAIALAAEPDLLIADAPTSSLDVLTQARMLGLLDRLCRKHGLALLLISHDLGVVSSLVERVIVMLAGTIVEEAPIRDFLDTPLHPYSQSVVATAQRASPSETRATTSRPAQSGCAFANQCRLCIPECKQGLPDLTTVGAGRAVRCPIVATEVDQ